MDFSISIESLADTTKLVVICNGIRTVLCTKDGIEKAMILSLMQELGEKAVAFIKEREQSWSSQKYS